MSERNLTCRACGAAVAPGAGACPRCGTARPTDVQTGNTLLGRPTPPPDGSPDGASAPPAGHRQPPAPSSSLGFPEPAAGGAPSRPSDAYGSEARAAVPSLAPDAPTQAGQGPAPPIRDDEAAFAPGAVLLSHYRIVRRLGQGGMGAVYLARDDVSGQEVAVKVLPASLARERDIRERFVQEARALAALDHPAIVPLITFSTVGEDRFLVMKYVDGEALDARLSRQGPLDFDAARAVIRTVVEALGYAHARGVIHRDVKPANVLVANDGRVFLVDFGIAKSEQSTRLTQTGMLMGTPQYMSPEQISGGVVDGRSDLYAAGLVLFEMLCGRPPFEGDKTFAILRAHVEQPVPDPRALRGEDIPHDLLYAIHALLQKDPGARPENAGAVLRILDGDAPAAELPFAGATQGGAAPPAPAPARAETPVTTAFQAPPSTAVSAAFFSEVETEGDDDIRLPRSNAKVAAVLGLLVVLAGGAGLYAFRDRLLAGLEADAETTGARVEKATDAPQTADRLMELAQGHLSAGRAEVAVALLEDAVVEAPERADAALMLVEALLADRRLDDVEKAIRELRAREGLDPIVEPQLARLEQDLKERRAEQAKAKKRRERPKRKPLPNDLGEDVLRAVAGKTRIAARNCYQAHVLRQDPGAGGDVTLEVAIEQSGKVSNVLLVHQQVGGPELASCLTRIAGSWRFPAFQDTPRILFQYTFAFRPEAG